MNKIYKSFLKFARNNFRRNLSWLDRDEDSPTYGSFDRNFWHYKVTDYNSDILQQGTYTLIALYKREIPNNYSKKRIKNLIIASTNFIFDSFKKRGFFNEYYPNEMGYPPIAFLSNLLGDIFFEFPDFFENKKFKNNYINLNIYLSKLDEKQAANQYSMALSGLYKFLNFFPEYKNKTEIELHKKKFLSLQSDEGWFYEYGGFDLGYLSITLESLVNIYEITNDKDFLISINLIISFYSKIIDKNGKFPYTLNSRNTEYILPFGFIKASKFNKNSEALFYFMFKDFSNFSNFANSTDDRYISHYIFASIVKSLPDLKNKRKIKKFTFKKDVFFKKAGIIKKYVHEKNKTIYIGLFKGGILRIHNHENKSVNLQNGYRALNLNYIATNNYQSNIWKSKIFKNKYIISGKFIKCGFIESSTFKHFALRLSSYFFKNKLIKYLKNNLIFNKPDQKLIFKRKIIIKNKIIIIDTFEGFKNFKLKLNNKQNLRYVASADTFSDEDFSEEIIKMNLINVNKDKLKIINNYNL